MMPSLISLSGLTAGNFTHPADRSVLSKLKALPVVDGLVGTMVDLQKRDMEIALIASSIHATLSLTPRLYGVYHSVCEALGFTEPFPPLYTRQDPLINAYTTGADEPYICVTSAAVDKLEEDELRFILGHELGHVLAGHVRYSTLTQVLLNISLSTGMFAGIASMAVDMTALPLLMAWSRRSEYTADRGGLLACQDSDAAFRALMKMGGYPTCFEREIRADEFLKQLVEFESCVSSSVLDQVFSLRQQLNSSHPRVVERAAELRLWIEDGSYDDVYDADALERIEMARQADADPQYAELLAELARVLKRWSVSEYGVPTSEAARCIRRMIASKTPLKNTVLEQVLRIELLVETESATRLTYSLLILSAKEGQPRRTKLFIPYTQDRDYAPASIRRELSRVHGRTATWLIYTL